MAGRRNPGWYQELAGNPGHRPIRGGVGPRPKRKMPRMPEWLDQIGQAKWGELSKVLFPLGLLTEADGDALAAYCDHHARAVRAREAVAAQGEYITLPGGSLQRHPGVRTLVECERGMRILAQRLGLDPASRQRILVEEPPRRDIGSKYFT